MKLTLKQISVPEGLESAVRERIRKEAVAARRKRFIFFGIAEALSTAACVVSAVYVFHSMTASGAAEYLSLLFSEGTGLFAYARDFIFLMLESLPVAGLAALVGAVAAMTWFAVKLAGRNNYHYLNV